MAQRMQPTLTYPIAGRRTRHQCLLRRLNEILSRRDAGRTKLELWDLTHRIKLGVGQDIGCGFRKAERDEHHAFRHIAILTRLERDRAPTRLDRDKALRT